MDPSAFSLIYTEVLLFTHRDLYMVLDAEEYGAERVMIRRWVVRLAVIRGIIQEAQRRKNFPGCTFALPAPEQREAPAQQVILDHRIQADIFNDCAECKRGSARYRRRLEL